MTAAVRPAGYQRAPQSETTLDGAEDPIAPEAFRPAQLRMAEVAQRRYGGSCDECGSEALLTVLTALGIAEPADVLAARSEQELKERAERLLGGAR